MITISQKILANRISTKSSSAYQPNHRKEYQDPETVKQKKLRKKFSYHLTIESLEKKKKKILIELPKFLKNKSLEKFSERVERNIKIRK